MLLKAAYSKGLRRSRVFHGFASPVMLVSQGFQGLMIHVLSVNQAGYTIKRRAYSSPDRVQRSERAPVAPLCFPWFGPTPESGPLQTGVWLLWPRLTSAPFAGCCQPSGRLDCLRVLWLPGRFPPDHPAGSKLQSDSHRALDCQRGRSPQIRT